MTASPDTALTPPRSGMTPKECVPCTGSPPTASSSVSPRGDGHAAGAGRPSAGGVGEALWLGTEPVQPGDGQEPVRVCPHRLVLPVPRGPFPVNVSVLLIWIISLVWAVMPAGLSLGVDVAG